MRTPKPSRNPATRIATRLVLLLVVLGGLWVYDHFLKERPEAVAPPPRHSEKTARQEAGDSPRAASRKSSAEDSPSQQDFSREKADERLVMKGLALRDERGKVIYRGEIDLAPTLKRIAAERSLPFANDGATFQNRERRLPSRAPGYYREWVVPTPGVNGPGPQRLVTGAEGEVWYTSDHYRTFRGIETKWP